MEEQKPPLRRGTALAIYFLLKTRRRLVAVRVGRRCARRAGVAGRQVAGGAIGARLADLRMRHRVTIVVMAYLGGSHARGRHRNCNCRCHQGLQHGWTSFG